MNIKKIDGNWVEGTYKGHFFCAKMFSVGSEYGIGGGRVSKLAVTKGAKWNYKALVFNYDRGMDVDSPIGHEINGLLEESNILREEA